MSNIPDAINRIQQEETQFRSSISSSIWRRVGGDLNYLLHNIGAIPVGTVKKAFLTEAQFQDQLGETWVLADGRDVTGSDYATLFGSNNIPDMRGTFTRGKDNGAGLDETGDPALASYQLDNVPYHIHTITVTRNDATATQKFPVFGYVIDQDFDTNGSQALHFGDATVIADLTISNLGANDTRARALICNYFIKINNAV